MTSVIKRSQLNRPLTCAEYDSNLDAVRERANHTGTQSASTIFDLEAAIQEFTFISDLETCCEELRTELDGLRDDIFGEGELSTIINNLRNQILEMIDDVIEDATDLLARIEALEDSVESINTSITSLNSSISNLTNIKANINSPTFTGVPKAPTPPSNSNDTQIATTAFVKSFSLPLGIILPYAAAGVPDSTWGMCDGAAVSRTTYATLFALIGTTYGAGNGTTTFNLPNLNYRVPIGMGSSSIDNYELGEAGGSERHTLAVNEMPSHGHSGSIGDHTHNVNDPTHAHQFYAYTSGDNDNSDAFSHANTGIAGERDDNKGYINNNGSGTQIIANSPTGITISSASGPITVNNTGGGEPHNNMQPYLVVNYIIKIA